MVPTLKKKKILSANDVAYHAWKRALCHWPAAPAPCIATCFFGLVRSFRVARGAVSNWRRVTLGRDRYRSWLRLYGEPGLAGLASTEFRPFRPRQIPDLNCSRNTVERGI